MAITVEELVVSLGLDADKLKNGAQEAAEALQPVKSIVDDINKSLKGMQSSFDAFRNWNRAISGGGAGRKTSASKSKTAVPEYTNEQVYGAGKPMPEIYGMIPAFLKKEKRETYNNTKSIDDVGEVSSNNNIFKKIDEFFSKIGNNLSNILSKKRDDDGYTSRIIDKEPTHIGSRENIQKDGNTKSGKKNNVKFKGSLFDNATKMLKGIAPGLASVVYMVKSASDAIQGVADKIKAAALEGTQMGNMAQRVGIASKSLQGLGAVAERMGYSASNAMADLENTITGIPALAGDQLPAILAAFRIPTHDIKSGLVRDTDSILKDLFTAINVRTKGDVKEAARFAKSLGVSQDFMQIAAKGWDNFIIERARLEREGVIVGNDVLENLKDMNKNFREFGQITKSTYTTFISSLSPLVNAYLSTLTGLVQGIKGTVLDPLTGHIENFFHNFRKLIVNSYRLTQPFGMSQFLGQKASDIIGDKIYGMFKNPIDSEKISVQKKEQTIREDQNSYSKTNNINSVPDSVSIEINGVGTQNPTIKWNGSEVKKSVFNSFQHPLSQ